MECAGRGRATRCTGLPTRRCGRCGAVAYCSVSHQISHWSDHKEECERLEQQMKRVDELNDFPFTFAREATFEVFDKQETRCSFLSKRGLHRLGMWMVECCCGASPASFDCLIRSTDEGWNLSNEQCPCHGPVSPTNHLTSWIDYYDWRRIPLHSPVCLILQWPLTIYHAIQVALMRSSTFESCNELCIHYLGPEKELLQLAAFGELHALFPGMKGWSESSSPQLCSLLGYGLPLQAFKQKCEQQCSY